MRRTQVKPVAVDRRKRDERRARDRRVRKDRRVVGDRRGSDEGPQLAHQLTRVI